MERIANNKLMLNPHLFPVIRRKIASLRQELILPVVQVKEQYVH